MVYAGFKGLTHKKNFYCFGLTFFFSRKIEGMTHKTIEIIKLSQNYIKHTKKNKQSNSI